MVWRPTSCLPPVSFLERGHPLAVRGPHPARPFFRLLGMRDNYENGRKFYLQREKLRILG